jgi:hypothetical protein
MERSAALALLELEEGATESRIHQQVELRLSGLEERLARAPTPTLKTKYRAEISKVNAAKETLLVLSGPSQTTYSDLPVSQKLSVDDDVQPPEAEDRLPASGGRRPPSRPSANKSPAASEGTPAPNGRRQFSRAETAAPGVRGPQRPEAEAVGERAPPQRSRPSAGPVDEEDDYGELPPLQEEVVSRPSNPRRTWTIIGVLVLLCAAGVFGGWKWWYVPREVAAHQEVGSRELINLTPTVLHMSDAGELSHGKARALSWLSVALSSTGRGAEASSLIAEANAMLAKSEASFTKDEDQCRLFAAQAAKGECEAAVAALIAMQTNREKLAREGRPLPANAPPPRVPLHEDNARRSIAIAQARHNQVREAVGMVNSISPTHDEFACEALAEIARQLVAAGDSQQAIQVVQSLEQRAKKIVDPLVRAPLLAFVAEQMNSLLGSTKAKPFISDALGGMSSFSSGSSGMPPPSDIEARKTIAQAIMLPVAMRFGGEAKDTYRKKLEDVTAQASNLLASTGTISGQPDFKNRARAYAACAVAWSDLASHWFSGDARARADDAIAKALDCAEQARPPTKVAGAEDALNVQYSKEQALTAVVAALSEMHNFDKAREVIRRIALPENLGPASEVLAYHLGKAGRVDEGEALVRDIPEGEPRVRAAIGFHYGLNQLPLERWW